jgi:protein-L-isoaspartate(D-aspartate) O-methyltransferase
VSNRPPPRAPAAARFPATLERAGVPSTAARVEAPRASRPEGAGLDSGTVRLRMVRRLREDGVIADERVLAALGEVPRHRFVDAALASQAYEDTSLPIGAGQTISKPSVVGRMLELLLQGEAARQTASLGRTLEIGTGCGYQAALLAQLATSVISIERIAALHELARERLAPVRPRDLRLVLGDGLLGHAPNAPYRSIIAAAAGTRLPAPWLEQLEVGGRLVAPLVDAGTGRQSLVVVDRTPAGYQHRSDAGVMFVPLKSGTV